VEVATTAQLVWILARRLPTPETRHTQHAHYTGTLAKPLRRAGTLHPTGEGAVFEAYDFGPGFRTIDGIATSATGEKMAWLKDSEGSLVSIGAH
jgi:hypothetical protein